MAILEALAASSLSMWVLTSKWGYYGLLVVHAIGMAGIVGSTFMVCLRVLGLARGVIITDLGSLRAVAWGGFLANAISGVILFFSNGPALVQNGTFQIKMLSIVLGGIALGVLWRVLNRDPGKDDPNTAYGAFAKAAAIATFAFWTIAIIFGRDVAYTLEPVFDLNAF